MPNLVLLEPIDAQVRRNVIRRAHKNRIELVSRDLSGPGQQNTIELRTGRVNLWVDNLNDVYIRVLAQDPISDLAHITVAKDKAVHLTLVPLLILPSTKNQLPVVSFAVRYSRSSQWLSHKDNILTTLIVCLYCTCDVVDDP